MLKKLYIKNFALIKETEISFAPSLNLLTGETGAGKSLLLGAISLILGEKIKQSLILNPDEKCIVEAEFQNVSDKKILQYLEENEILEGDTFWVRREIFPSGRSRAFINDSPIPANELKQLLQNVVNLHSQDETSKLLNPSYQLKLLDKYAGIFKEVEDFEQKFKELNSLKKILKEKQELAEKQNELKELYEFQYKELSQIPLDEIDEEKLEQEIKQFEQAENLLRLLNDLEFALFEAENAPYEILARSRKELENFSDTFQELENPIESFYNIENLLQDIIADLDKLKNKIDLNPEEIREKQELFNELNRIKIKYRLNSVAELIEKRNSLEQELTSLQNTEQDISELILKIQKLENLLREKALFIETKRKEASLKLSEEINNLLEALNLKDASFRIIVGRTESKEETRSVLEIEGKKYKLFPTGINWTEFRIQTNPGSPEGLLSAIASGGERSRIMLALKTALAEKLETQVLIFDEIDAGISGATAMKVGKIIEKLAEKRQVIVITHLPQIASRKGKHFRISKTSYENTTETSVQELSSQERQKEIARLLSGEPVTPVALENAKELLKL